MRFIALLLLPLFSYGQFDTGLTQKDKYTVGALATIGGLTLINHSDGPTEAIGAVWLGGGIMNLYSAEAFRKRHQYDPDDVEWSKEILPISTMFLAGAVNGLNQDLLFHYSEFQNTFPNADPQFWDPALSWRNKYKNGDPAQGEAFPGSSTIFVAATDGYHATVAARNIMITTSIVLSSRTFKWKPFLKRTAIYSLSYGLGFELVYAKIVK
jgi:hypothetical protein